MLYVYKEPYNYSYGKYVVIKKFKDVKKQILEKAKLLFNDSKIIVDEGGEKELIFKKAFYDQLIKDIIETEIEKVYGNLFGDYYWFKETYEGEESARYLSLQYFVAAIALKFFNKLSPIEAADEAAFLVKYMFHSRGVPHPWLMPVKTKTQFLDMYILSNNCLNIYLVVKYLEQLGFSKNPVKDKELVSKIQEGIKQLEEDMSKRKLTKEEWEARDKTKRRVQY